MTAGIGRRHFFQAGAGIAVSSLVSVSDVRASGPAAVNFKDPAFALEAYVKLRGSTASETTFRPYDGDLFRVQDGEIGAPLCGVRGVQKSHWRREADGSFSNRDYDIGVYVDFETRIALKDWKNPLTGRTVFAQPYRSGPSGANYKPGVKSNDTYSDPVGGRWAMIGRQACHTSVRSAEIKNPLTPEEYPLASTGPTYKVSMSTSYSGDMAEIADPAIHNASSMMVWTDLASWMPWMEMGLLRGANLWRMLGFKVQDRSQIPSDLIELVEAVFPGYVTEDTVWDGPSLSGYQEYKRVHLPQK